MKGKPTWKPTGLDAQKWRSAAYAKEPSGLLAAKLLRQEPAGRKSRRGGRPAKGKP